MAQAHIADFFKDEYSRLVHYVRGLISAASDMDAEDFVQDVIVQILERADPVAPLENLAAYVYASLRNRVTDYFRRRRPKLFLEEEPEQTRGLMIRDLLRDQRIDAAAALESQEWRAALFKAIRQLNGIEQEVLIATEFEDRKFRELSEQWDIPLNTLLSHKARAIQKLGQSLIAWKTT
jgi:RNA polymerase sigma-70 factor (ECF subfamily)